VEGLHGMTAAKKVGECGGLPITSFSPGVQQIGGWDYDDSYGFCEA